MERHESVTTAVIHERVRVSWLSLIFGYGAMVPFVAGAVSVLLLEGFRPALAARLTVLWGCAILFFLAGVRRGLSFRTPGGPTVAQLATMLWLFLLGAGALVIEALLPLWSRTAVTLLITGYVSLLVLDPIAARRGEVPPFFARLRPVQMLIPVLCLGVLAYAKLG